MTHCQDENCTERTWETRGVSLVNDEDTGKREVRHVYLQQVFFPLYKIEKRSRSQNKNCGTVYRCKSRGNLLLINNSRENQVKLCA